MKQIEKTLGRLNITEDTLFKGIIKRNATTRFILTIFITALGLSMYTSYQNQNAILIGTILSLLITWISIIPSLTLKNSNPNRKALVLRKELNNPKHMYQILKYNTNVNKFEDLDKVSLNKATKFDYELLEGFILDYKLTRQLTVMCIAMIVGGLVLMSTVDIFYNVFLRWLFGALITALVVLMLYFFLKLFNNLPYKIIFRNFESYSDRCFDIGALSPLHYKILKLFYNDYASEGQFELEDYNDLIAEGVISKRDVVGDYIKDINYIRFTSLLSLGVGIACILQYLNLPIHYSVSAILISLILIILGRVRITERSIRRYEVRLINDSCKLTSKVMKYLPKEYKEMF